MCLKFLRSAALCLLLCSTSVNGLNGFLSGLFGDDEETGVFEDNIILVNTQYHFVITF